ncbi:MAG: hypothetical protein R3F42_08560 [Pseudomonadota bacterium]
MTSGRALAPSLFATAVAAELVTDSNLVINRIGSHEGNIFYITTFSGFSQPCQYDTAYYATDNPDCGNLFQIALLAKSRRLVSRIDYDYYPVNFLCKIKLLETK